MIPGEKMFALDGFRFHATTFGKEDKVHEIPRFSGSERQPGRQGQVLAVDAEDGFHLLFDKTSGPEIVHSGDILGVDQGVQNLEKRVDSPDGGDLFQL